MVLSTAGSCASACANRRARSAETSGEASVFGMIQPNLRPELRCRGARVLRLRRPAVGRLRLRSTVFAFGHDRFGRVGQGIVRMAAIALEEGAGFDRERLVQDVALDAAGCAEL